jgi:hypothetical protein
MSGFRSSPYVHPLKEKGDPFLQVLLTDLELSRNGDGAVLEVRFDRDTPSVSQRVGRIDIKARVSDFEKEARRWQNHLDDFMLRGVEQKLRFGSEDFPFRYGGGGGLPVLHVASTENTKREPHYCMFFRDVDPIGWNIANGGSSTLAELLDPDLVIEREFREELILSNPDKRLLYVYDEPASKAVDLHEIEAAYRVWHQHFPRLDFASYDKAVIPLRWDDGPDEVRVEFDGEVHTTTGCFLNINGLDYGIEIERVAHVDVDRDLVVCDGELAQGGLLNQIVGLFPVDRVNEMVLGGEATHFLPDRVFFSGIERDVNEMETIVGEYLATVGPRWREADYRIWDEAIRKGTKYDLCPPTRTIVRRYAGISTKGTE